MIPSILKAKAGPLYQWITSNKSCLLCSASPAKNQHTSLCAPCSTSVKEAALNKCALCGKPLEFEYEIETGETYECGECREKAPPFAELRYALEYSGSVRKLALALKFDDRRRLAKPLAHLAQNRLHPWLLDKPDAVIIPVPLAMGKLYQRGYNHSYLLARELCKTTGHPVLEGVLRRIRNTKPQHGLTTKERAQNVRGAFAVHDPSAIAGRQVILFDDIYTTGATVTELCRTIKKAKPTDIFVATICRTP